MALAKQPFNTPKGEFRWVYITGAGKTNLQNEQEYTVNVVLPADAAADTCAEIEAFWEENKPKGAKAPKSLGFKADPETGDVTFVLKTKTTYTDGKAKEIKVYNSKAQPIEMPDGVRIGNGSRGRASGTMSIYDGGPAARGVTLYLSAIQLTKLEAFKGGDPGFAADDEDDFDGFAGTATNPFGEDWEN